jgi:hypothetical protein
MRLSACLALILLVPGLRGEEGQRQPTPVDRAAVQQLLADYLAAGDHKARRQIEDELLELEQQTDLDGELVVELLASPSIRKPDRSTFRLRGKQGPPEVEWPERRVQIRELGDAAPDFYTVSLPPGYDEDEPTLYPVVLDLGYGIGSLLASGANPEHPVLVALVHPDALPSQGTAGSRQGQSLILSILEDLPRRVHVDPDRVFLTGGGRLGNAVYYMAAHHPHRFAGVIPSSGHQPSFKTFERNAEHLGWLIASRRPGRYTTQIYEFNFDTFERLKELGTQVSFRLLDEQTEPRAFLKTAVKFLEETYRDPWPDELSCRMNDDDHGEHYWIRIDKVKRPGRPKVIKILGDHGGTTDTRTVNTRLAAVDARVHDRRRIEITTENVKHLTVLLSPQLVDWDQKVTITVNGEERRQEVPKTSLRLILKRFRTGWDTTALPWDRVQLLNL